jgi:hypothetical protein
MSWMIVGLIEWGEFGNSGNAANSSSKIERCVLRNSLYYCMICVIVSVMGGGDWGNSLPGSAIHLQSALVFVGRSTGHGVLHYCSLYVTMYGCDVLVSRAGKDFLEANLTNTETNSCHLPLFCFSLHPKICVSVPRTVQ